MILYRNYGTLIYYEKKHGIVEKKNYGAIVNYSLL